MPGDKKMAADGVSHVDGPVTPEGGDVKSNKADVKKKVDVDAETVDDGTTKVTKNAEKIVEESEDFDLASLFEGLDLSEDFKTKAGVVFEAAVNESAITKAAALTEEATSKLEEEFNQALTESINEMTDNLDGYLDYIVSQWTEENKLAIDSGIKVEMAESLLEGLKELFQEHNVEISEDKVDLVAELEEELVQANETANRTISDLLKLEEKVNDMEAEKVFLENTSGLSGAQIERLRGLSERVDSSNLEAYSDNLKTLKESFFKNKTMIINEDIDTEGKELLEEKDVPKSKSSYDHVNALAAAMKTRK